MQAYLLAELELLDGIYLLAADVNQDGVIDISDATTLQRNAFSYSGVLRQNIGAKQGLRECDAESAGKGVVGDRS